MKQYIIRNPFSVDKMQPNSSGDSIIYRSGMNPKIQRNFEVFSPCDFIARITQHIPDKSFQLVRYYGWYSNKMRGQRLKQTEAEVVDAPEGAPRTAFIRRRKPFARQPQKGLILCGCLVAGEFFSGWYRWVPKAAKTRVPYSINPSNNPG